MGSHPGLSIGDLLILQTLSPLESLTPLGFLSPLGSLGYRNFHSLQVSVNHPGPLSPLDTEPPDSSMEYCMLSSAHLSVNGSPELWPIITTDVHTCKFSQLVSDKTLGWRLLSSQSSLKSPNSRTQYQNPEKAVKTVFKIIIPEPRTLHLYEPCVPFYHFYTVACHCTVTNAICYTEHTDSK